jgi:hypothetical protein
VKYSISVIIYAPAIKGKALDGWVENLSDILVKRID